MFLEEVRKGVKLINNTLKRNNVSVYPEDDGSAIVRGGYGIRVDEKDDEGYNHVLYLQHHIDEYIEKHISDESRLVKGIIE